MATKDVGFSSLTVTFHGAKGQTGQVYTNNGLSIAQGETLTLTKNDLPEGFPFSLEELAAQMKSVKGMEVI